MRLVANKPWIKTFVVAGLPTLAALFAIYLAVLYQQLRTTFEQNAQIPPTRIYSDVTEIRAGLQKVYVEERLRALNYPATALEEESPLHDQDYPTDKLVPDAFRQATARPGQLKSRFKLEWDPAAPRVARVLINGQEAPALYLEPELIATLTQGGEGGDRRQARTYLALDQIPTSIRDAIVAIEDQHFREHMGFDPRGLARAVWVNLRTLSFSQGGSTLTQQLVKNLMARRSKNLFRKVNELFLAILLEFYASKDAILERYLNEVYLGQVGNIEVHGVAEGARHFFGKKVSELHLGEIALLAGLIRGPAYYSPYRFRERAVERQHLVLRKMVETQKIFDAEATEAAALPLRLTPPQTAANRAPYFVDYVKSELTHTVGARLGLTEDGVFKQGFKVYTTLDPVLNGLAQKAVADEVTALETRYAIHPPDRLEGALASVDPRNGFVRALVGGRSYAQSTFNRILNMRRQVGSTFKPVVYLEALRRGRDAQGLVYGPGHPALDEPWTLKFDRGKQSWTPRNYEKEHLGWTHYREALAHSVNTIAARLGQELGIPAIRSLAQRLGVQSEMPEVPSLALGVAELTPIELLKMYATFANHGVQEEFTVLRAVYRTESSQKDSFVTYFAFNSQAVVDAGPADLLTDMLTSIFTEGTAKSATALGLRYPAAGKTGTTSHHRDAWFAGYTPLLATVVWVGMDQAPAPATPTSAKEDSGDVEETSTTTAKLTGAGAALPVWVKYTQAAMDRLTTAPSDAQFKPVDPWIETPIDLHTGQQAQGGCPQSQVRTERFLHGAEPLESTCAPEWPDRTRLSF